MQRLIPFLASAPSLGPTGTTYHDALINKRSSVVLFLVELSGAIFPPAKRHMRWLAARAKLRDRTHRTRREQWVGFFHSWPTGFSQRLAAAIVGGDARWAFSALDKRAGLLT